MNVVFYSAPLKYTIKQIPRPTIGDDEILLKVTAAGVCGTDLHIHEYGLMSKFPLIPGHEIVGVVEELGKNVSGFVKGDRCVSDNILLCGDCFYCRHGRPLCCEKMGFYGVTLPGGFAEYVAIKSKMAYKFYNMTDEEATLVEPASCAIQAIKKLRPPIGCTALIFGAGPSGLMLAQVLKLNGATKVVLAANNGQKMELARKIDAADDYVDLDRTNPEPQFQRLREDYPHGFDVVIEVTGVLKIVGGALNYVRRGGTLLLYAPYDSAACVHWSPNKIFGNEITITASVAQRGCFGPAVDYLDSGKIRTKGIVSDVFRLADYEKVLDKMASREFVKIAIKP